MTSFVLPALTDQEKRRLNANESVVEVMSDNELLDLIDQRSRLLLGISGEEFLARYRRGDLTHDLAEGPVVVLATLLRAS